MLPKHCLLIFGQSVVFMGVMLWPSSIHSKDLNPELRNKVNLLIERLADPDPAKQVAAESALLKLGPAIRNYLPPTSDNKRLISIRSTLREVQAFADLAPHRITFQANGIPLEKALQELTTQTGIVVEDRRHSKDYEPKLTLDLDNVPFWKALDQIALGANLRISLYERDNKIALRDGANAAIPVCYDGLFRVTIKRLVTTRELETKSDILTVFLEIAWEPNFQPLFLETRPASLGLDESDGIRSNVGEIGSGLAPVTGRLAIEIPLRLPAPPRKLAALGRLQGSFLLVGPSKMLSFTFDNLGSAGIGTIPQKQIMEDVALTLQDFSTERSNDSDRWKVTFSLNYPQGGADFESFQSWLVNNEVYLEKKKGKDRVMPGAYETGEQSARQASLTYYFVEENGMHLGKPSDWTLVYHTPGTIIKLPVKFEFKNVLLP